VLDAQPVQGVPDPAQVLKGLFLDPSAFQIVDLDLGKLDAGLGKIDAQLVDLLLVHGIYEKSHG
jgi:hypothetical protein